MPGLASISGVPIMMIVAADDTVCAPVYAESIRAQIGESVHLFKTIPDADHGYFSDASTPEFLKLMQDTLRYYKPAVNPFADKKNAEVSFGGFGVQTLADMNVFGSDAGFSVITSVTLTALLAITMF